MNPVSSHKLFETMQQLADQASNKPAQSDKSDFKQALVNAVDSTNELSKQSVELSKKYELGDPNVELVDVMIASQKSSVSFQALTQVRNRLVNAYQDIMNMQI